MVLTKVKYYVDMAYNLFNETPSLGRALHNIVARGVLHIKLYHNVFQYHV